MNFNKTITRLKELFSVDGIKTKILPSVLIYCVASNRRGISAAMTASKVIENDGKIGIPTGTNEDGSPNLINLHDYNLIMSVIDAIKNDGVVHVSIPKGSIIFEGTGVNGGGPMTIIGTNKTDSIALGLIR